MKTLLVVALLALAGCTSNKLQGAYKVETVKKFDGKSIVKLEGLQKEFILPTDSVDKGEVVYINTVPNGK